MTSATLPSSPRLDEAPLEESLDIEPLGGDNAEHVGVTDAAVRADAVVANHAVLLRPERRNRSLRLEVEVVCQERQGGRRDVSTGFNLGEAKGDPGG